MIMQILGKILNSQKKIGYDAFKLGGKAFER